MRITDVDVISFRVDGHEVPHHRWGYAVIRETRDGPFFGGGTPKAQAVTLTRVSTDEGVCGYYFGGDRAQVENVVKPMIVGEDPLDRERIWTWMDQVASFRGNLSEIQMGIVDCALWDLAGRAAGLPVRKLLGGARDKVKAYASTYPNLGDPEVYARHAVACRDAGYTAYKIHAYICWDPVRWEPSPQQPAFPREDVAVCRAVREAVGDDMVLMLDPYGVYTLEEALWVGHQLEDLGFYWLEHPMIETRIEPYRRLARELSINICSPEHVHGGMYSRAEWILQGASDMLRIDAGYGGLTACWKAAAVCQAFGLKCELHGAGWRWPHTQLLGATSEATCEYYERGLLLPGVEGNDVPPYLEAIADPMDSDGYISVPDAPGLGMQLDWDYIEDNRIEPGDEADYAPGVGNAYS